MMISTTPSRVSRLRRPSPLRTGFTLVELLVVVGILALLVAILLPVLAGARESANNLRCQVQERNILQAMFAHAAAHDGYMPLVGDPRPGRDLTPAALGDPGAVRYSYYAAGTGELRLMSLAGALAPLMGQTVDRTSLAAVEESMQRPNVRQLFDCPSDSDQNRPGFTAKNGGHAYSSFVFSDAALGWGSSGDFTSGLRSIPRPHARLRGKVSRFVRPEQMFLFGDGLTRIDGYQLICDADGELTLRDVLVTSNGPAGNPTANSNPPPGDCYTWDTLDRSRHRGRINIAFADGHVETVPLTEAALSQVSLNKGFPASDPN